MISVIREGWRLMRSQESRLIRETGDERLMENSGESLGS